MKKMLSFILAVIFVLPMFAYSAISEESNLQDSKVEISFQVGDNMLQINGKGVEVEMPFVENGVTLVPLRIITEAFGAKVQWEEDTQKITLIYNDVIIELIINDKFVLVNQNKKELLTAPKIVNEKTMVPLRFITENFGATVSYDEQTGGITVVKEATQKPVDPPKTVEEDVPIITVSEPDAEGYKTYSNKNLNISFRFPKDYELQTHENNFDEIVLWKRDSVGNPKGIIYFSILSCGKIDSATEASDFKYYLSNYQEEIIQEWTLDRKTINPFFCQDIQSDKSLSGLNTNYFIYTSRREKIKSMHAVNNRYAYNLRFFDHDINWTSLNSDKVCILKDIKIQDIQRASNIIAEEWLKKDDLVITKKSTDYGDYTLKLPSSWKATENLDMFFENYGASFIQSKDTKILANGFIGYQNLADAKLSTSWMDMHHGVTFVHESGIAFNVTQILQTKARYLPIEAFQEIIKNEPNVKCILKTPSNNTTLNRTLRECGIVPKFVDLFDYTIVKERKFNYTYVIDNQLYYNTIQEVGTKPCTDLEQKGNSISYIVSISIPKHLYTLTANNIIDKIINSIEFQ